ncbi:carboxymuconolactone decarboxylase family protein [Rhodobacteraceae bacterium KMM 6894]|nr:carboxymuconolactone decarboxylase family protein [Rhodobacteraceae bacterium KMM 6894]
MDWKAELENTNKNIDALRAVHPGATKGFTGLHHGTMKAGVLSVKDKELQALAIGIAKQCVDCIGFHVKGAIAAGATREEVAETVGVCVTMGGGPALMYGAKAMDAFDQLS